MPHSTCPDTSNIVATTFSLDVDAKQRPKHVPCVVVPKVWPLGRLTKGSRLLWTVNIVQEAIERGVGGFHSGALGSVRHYCHFVEQGYTGVAQRKEEEEEDGGKGQKEGEKEDTGKIRSSVVPEEFSA